MSEIVHGANAALFYYEKNLRTGWYQVQPGMHVNADPAEQTNPFATLIIVTRGRAVPIVTRFAESGRRAARIVTSVETGSAAKV